MSVPYTITPLNHSELIVTVAFMSPHIYGVLILKPFASILQLAYNRGEDAPTPRGEPTNRVPPLFTAAPNLFAAMFNVVLLVKT